MLIFDELWTLSQIVKLMGEDVSLVEQAMGFINSPRRREFVNSVDGLSDDMACAVFM
jgi:hypothetical protein